MTFGRLRAAEWVAWLAALALVASLAVDWYSTNVGEEARRIEGLAEPSPTPSGQLEREVREDARIVAEGEERNAFQADAAIDRLILVVLLGAALLTAAAVLMRAAGRRDRPAATPIGAAGLAATIGAVLVAYRIVQEPGLDDATTIKAGAVAGLLSAGVLALAARAAARAEPDQPKPQDPTREEASAA